LAAALLLGLALVFAARTGRLSVPQVPLLGWLFVAPPVLIIVHHLFYLSVIKARAIRPTGFQSPIVLREHTEVRQLMDRAFSTNAHEYQHYFSWTSLLQRYAVPILLVMVSVLGVFYVICLPPDCCGGKLPPAIVEGLRFGALGPYVYLLLQLGQRSFQGDVTPGFTLWCAVQVVLGALLGGILSVIWTKGVDDAGQPVTATAAGFYFLAGLAPRLVVSAVQETLRRLWLPTSTSAAQVPRSIPLGQLRGISQSIEERLNEEGIYDSCMLAMANPLKLLRNTPFDRRQILAWIDEALLIATLPQNWQAVQNEGYGGAIDLAWLGYVADGATLATTPEVAALAERIKLSPVLLASVIRRLGEDAQVVQIWSLYQNEADDNP